MSEATGVKSIRKILDLLPTDEGIAVLLRHSCRPPIPEGETGSEISLTDEGERMAEKLGALIGNRIHQVYTSPLLRCRQTAQALVRGAGSRGLPIEDRRLGNPGPFVLDDRAAW